MGERPTRWDGDDLVAMVFDDHGNAVDSFHYTPDELRRRANELEGKPTVTVTVGPSPFLELRN